MIVKKKFNCVVAMNIALVLLALGALGLGGCGPSGSGELAQVTEGNNSLVSSNSGNEIPAVRVSRELSAFNESPAPDAWVIGLDADMSSGAARSGESIRRGIELAIDEINGRGGLRGRPVQLIVRDHRGNPDRGVDNLREFADFPNLLAVVGGIHTPVALKELPVIHEKQVLYLGAWAAGTGIVAHGFQPNLVFRVSIRDEHAGGFLVEQAIRRNYQRIGLLLERTGWGRSNENAIKQALQDNGLEPAGIEWFNWGEKAMDSQISRLLANQVDVILLVCNPLEGTEIVESMANVEPGRRVPIISHWGITAGEFYADSREALQVVDLSFVQSYSFLKSELRPAAAQLANKYIDKYADAKSYHDIFCPVGTAHAYELMRMLELAVQGSDATDAISLSRAMEGIQSYAGVIKDYDAPFEGGYHDALNADDFILAKYAEAGVIVPVNENE